MMCRNSLRATESVRCSEKRLFMAPIFRADVGRDETHDPHEMQSPGRGDQRVRSIARQSVGHNATHNPHPVQRRSSTPEGRRHACSIPPINRTSLPRVRTPAPTPAARPGRSGAEIPMPTTPATDGPNRPAPTSPRAGTVRRSDSTGCIRFPGAGPRAARRRRSRLTQQVQARRRLMRLAQTDAEVLHLVVETLGEDVVETESQQLTLTHDGFTLASDLRNRESRAVPCGITPWPPDREQLGGGSYCPCRPAAPLDAAPFHLREDFVEGQRPFGGRRCLLHVERQIGGLDRSVAARPQAVVRISKSSATLPGQPYWPRSLIASPLTCVTTLPAASNAQGNRRHQRRQVAAPFGQRRRAYAERGEPAMGSSSNRPGGFHPRRSRSCRRAGAAPAPRRRDAAR